MTMVKDIKGLKLNKDDSFSDKAPNRETSSKQSPCEVDVASHANISPPMPLGDCSNRTAPLIPAKLVRKWSKLTCDSNSKNQATLLLMDFDHRIGLESNEEQGGKRQCMDICKTEDKENFQVIASF